MYISIFSTILSETFLILRKIQRDIVINVHKPSCKVTDILVTFEWNLNFLNKFSKNTQISHLMKAHLVGAELFRADGRTDVTKLIVGFRNFTNATKSQSGNAV